MIANSSFEYFYRAAGRREIRIPWEQVENVGPDVKLNVAVSATGATHAEDWVREKIIDRIPGSG